MIAFQLLSFRVEVAFDDERLLPALRYLANGARQPVRPSHVLRYTVAGHGPYELFEAEAETVTLATPDDVLYVLYRRCHTRLFDDLSRDGWVPVHGGIVGIGGRRALVIGARGAGKTTLLLRLLYDGHHVEGDEMVFTRGGVAMCLPRNFHVKSGTRELVPELLAGWDALPATSTSDGRVISGFNPAAAGLPWTVLQAPVDLAFVLHADHGSVPAVRPLSGVALVAAAVANCFGRFAEQGDVVRACARLLGEVSGYELTVGEVTTAADLIVAVAGRGADRVSQLARIPQQSMEVLNG